MRNKLYIISLLTLLVLPAWGQKTKKSSIDGVRNIDSTVYYYYLQCSRSIGEPRIMQMSDTLYQMALERGDNRTMCAAMCFKQEYWIARDNADSVKYYKDLLQRMSLEYDLPLYYYYSWSRMVESLLAMHRHQSAMDELTAMRAQIDSSDLGMTTYLKLMAKYFNVERNYNKACEYAVMLVEYVEKKDMTDFNQHLNYIDVVDNLTRMEQYDKAQQWLSRAWRKASLRKSQQVALNAAETRLRVAMGDYRGARLALDKVNALEPQGFAIKDVMESNMLYYRSTQNYPAALMWLTRYDSLTHLGNLYLREHSDILFHMPGHEKEAARIAIQCIEQMDSLTVEEQNARILEYASAMKLDELRGNIQDIKNRNLKATAIILVCVVAILSTLLLYLVFTRRRLANSIRNEAVATNQKDRLEGELGAARSMQQRMLHTAFPKDKRMAMSATLESALQVSGDLYDYLEDGDRVHFIVGDVSGKGMAASLFMSVASCSFRTFARQSRSAAHIMQRINGLTCSNNPQNTFITALVGTLDLNTGELTLCNAGHTHPLLLTRDARGEYFVKDVILDVNIPLGLMPEHEYGCSHFRLKPGDKLFLYTDGVSERENDRLALFGEERLRSTLLEVASQPVDEMVDHCKQCLSQHANGAQQNDDITMMVIEYTGNSLDQ